MLKKFKAAEKNIDAYLNRLNLTEKVNTSYEWAGGGLVSTTSDLALFIEALFSNKVFKENQPLKE
jgi:D-alanyl-D-alanine carboxypeptidase